ncbi:MAG: tRNA pseudouridine(55) synthase TruB, partial [Polyangiaceae bacterium]|nr:tRNA pseudouridine(55) synthase TruB [Polyangiaceae bacterium]
MDPVRESSEKSLPKVLSGILVVDKPKGPTSHDVVAMVRRVLRVKSVGHAGTLDPMATGVLVILVGAATKLSQFLSLDDKKYLATVRLGQGTDTLDAEGSVTSEAQLGSLLASELEHIEREQRESGRVCLPVGGSIGIAMLTERARIAQVPPAYSAIKRDGVVAYQRARRGEQVELPSRDVQVFGLDVVGVSTSPPELRIELHVSKGYYVRSLARDLGTALGIPSHLVSLRRLSSGEFGLDGAVVLGAVGGGK